MTIKMENLPQKKENTFLELRKPTLKAIDKRRQMLEIPEVTKSLTSVEKYIFEASTKTLISEMSDFDLVNETRNIFKFIAKDVGYRIPTDPTDWQYTCARLLKYLKMYHSKLALSEIPLAFELSVNGDLDQFLPKGKDDQPDKNHYQEFNIDFFGKIIKAYKEKQSTVIHKATDNIPLVEYIPSPEASNFYHNKTVNACKECFEAYKEKGDLNLEGLKSMFVWEWLQKEILIKEPNVTEEDREKALTDYLKKADLGLFNRYTAAVVKKEGINSKSLDFDALEIARNNKIKKTFDAMISKKIDITKYLNYKS
jgi:hypothetical protein